MGRAILILFACSVLMLAIAYQTQPQIITTMLAYIEGNSGRAAGPATVQLSEPEKVAVRVPAAKGSTRNVPPVPETLPVAPSADADKESDIKRPLVFKVATESTTLYAHNSSKAPVVGVLQKGEIVEPQLEVSEGGERWAFVQVKAQNISGFVQTQDLERK